MSACYGKAKTNLATHRSLRQRLNAPQRTILVAEDHDDTREMLCMLLRKWGCRVVEACNGLEAVEAALRERPALILMDGSLPFLDGLDATRRIRENGLGTEVKILALDSWGSPSYHAAALVAGCDDCIVKPFDIDRLWRYMVRSSLVPLKAQKETTDRVPCEVVIPTTDRIRL